MKILYNKNKWLDIYNLPKYEAIRTKILTSFDGLSFIEEGHKYFLKGKEMECVSNVAHLFQEHIDSLKLATETFERNFNKENERRKTLLRREFYLRKRQKGNSHIS